MPAFFSSMSLRKLGALTGLIAAGIAIATSVVAGLIVLERLGRANVDRYGSTIANQLAGLAAAPVVTHDSITLNVITTHLADDPAIINAAVYTQDNRLLTTGGRISVEATRGAQTANVFKRNITFEGQNIGYVRVVIDELALAPPLDGWLWLAAGVGALLATWFGALLGGRAEKHLLETAVRLEELLPESPAEGTAFTRLRRVGRQLVPDPEPQDNATGDDVPQGPPPYLVVLNLFNLFSLGAGERERVLNQCADRVAQVCDLYGGRVARLPATGLFVLVDAQESADHAFHAICATLLAMRLLIALNDERQKELWVRAGVLQLAEHPRAQDADGLREELDVPLSEGIVLSATARNGALLAEGGVFHSLTDAQRLVWSAVRMPITSWDEEHRFHYQITGVNAAIEPLLARQAERLLSQV